VVLIFDDFDEVGPKYKETFLDTASFKFSKVALHRAVVGYNPAAPEGGVGR